MKDKELKCPNCNAVGTLIYQDIQQGAYEHKVLKNGKISKRRKFVLIGTEEWSLIRCEKCNASWVDTNTKNGFEIKNGNQVIFQEIDNEYDMRKMR